MVLPLLCLSSSIGVLFLFWLFLFFCLFGKRFINQLIRKNTWSFIFSHALHQSIFERLYTDVSTFISNDGVIRYIIESLRPNIWLASSEINSFKIVAALKSIPAHNVNTCA